MIVAFHNLGCKVNAYETERMIQAFKEAGHEITEFDKKSDIYIVNTCTVTNIADRKSRQMLHRAKALNPEAVVVACGCFAEMEKEKAEKDSAVDVLVANSEKKDIVRIVEDYFLGRKEEKDLASILSANETEDQGCLKALHDHTRAYIKIQDGCDQFCSYCIIPYARGRIKSRPKEDIIRELKALSENGIREVVLTGIHLSSYGIDFRAQASYNERAREGEYVNRELIEIIREAAAIEGIDRIRLGSLEPRIITDELLMAVKESKKVCPHFHLSLQSGSDSVLKRMNRRYDTEEYYNKIEMIRGYFEHPAITTDVIAGFPQETEEEFLETRDFLNKIGFYEVHIFKYSRRKGTLADSLKGQLTEKKKEERAKLLSLDDKERRRSFREYYIGRNEEVLFEERKLIDGEAYYTGFNREYVKFACRSKKDLTNKLVTGRAVAGSLNNCLCFCAD